MTSHSDQLLAAASRLFFDHVTRCDLPPNAYKLLLVLFRETIRWDKRDTGILSNDEICDIADLSKSSFNDAQRALQDAGWLEVNLGTNKSKIRTLLIPEIGVLYDLAEAEMKKGKFQRRRPKRKPKMR